MKRVLSAVLLVILASAAFAQNDPIGELFDKYSGKEGITSVYISEGLFKILSDMEEQQGELKGDLAGLTGLKSIRILAVDDDEGLEGINFFKELEGKIPYDQYEEVMVVREKDQDVRMLVRQTNGNLNEFLLIVGGEDNALISIVGDISKAIMSEWSEHGGLDSLIDID